MTVEEQKLDEPLLLATFKTSINEENFIEHITIPDESEELGDAEWESIEIN